MITAMFFKARWCGPCHAMEKDIKDACEEEYVALRIIDVENGYSHTKDNFVNRVPTFIVKGRTEQRAEGLLNKEQIRDLIRSSM